MLQVYGDLKSDAIQNRAIQCFVVVHTFTPLLAAQGDMGWVPKSIKRKCEMIQLFNHLVKMQKDHTILHRLLGFSPLWRTLSYNISIGII